MTGRTPPSPLFNKEGEEAKPQGAFKKRCRRVLLTGARGCPPDFSLFPQDWGIRGGSYIRIYQKSNILIFTPYEEIIFERG